MTKNRRREKNTGHTSQGVRDLNSMGPRKQRPEEAPSAQALEQNDKLGRAVHGRRKMGLPDKT